MKTIKPLEDLDQHELKEIIYSDRPMGVYVDLRGKFSDEEIIKLYEHPNFEKFSLDLKEIIIKAIMDIFERDLKGSENLH